MTEEKDIKDNKKVKGSKKTLSLKTDVNPTQIRSNFSSSRANTVVVETKRKRVIRNPEKRGPQKLLKNGFCMDSAHFFTIEKVSVVFPQEHHF